MGRWLRWIGASLAAALIVATATGAILEFSAQRRAAREFPARGVQVDVGGRRLHLDCRGAGTPIVVFESGLDSMGSLSWSAVQDPVARFTRACSYDRAGLMWSDPAGGARDGDAIAADLHAALSAAGESGPYVMVAHSLGGPYAMCYTKRYGSDVAGLVFVDASHPDQQRRIKEATGQAVDAPATAVKVLAALAWFGLPRLIAPSEGHPKAPAQVNAAMAAYLPQSLGGLRDELASIDATLREAGELRTLGDRPLMVLTAAAPYGVRELAALEMTAEQGRQLQAAWLAMQDEEAGWSSQGRHERVDDAGHYIQFERPDVVIAAVRNVVDAVRAGGEASKE